MSNRLTSRWHVDTDIALGSGAGDPDDGFALAFAIASGLGVRSVSSVYGNTTSHTAAQCARSLMQTMGTRREVIVAQGASHAGESVPHVIPTDDPSLNILALGPLTNIAHRLLAESALSIASITILGSNATSAARFPPISPFEFNLTKDRWATKVVFRSVVPLRIAPLDVAKRLTLTDEVQRRLAEVHLPRILATEATRWSVRSQKIGRTCVPVWDLVAAFWARHPELCVSETRLVRTTLFGRVEYDAPNGRPVEVLKAFAPGQVWDYFFAALKSHRDNSPAHSNL